MAIFSGTMMDDLLMGMEDDDVLWGGMGDDMLSGGDGDDRLIGGPGADVLDGGMGHDIASYVDSLQGVQVDLSGGMASMGGDAEGDSLTGIEELWGSRFADYLMGDRGMNRLFGRGGNDDLMGGNGDDLLRGGDGHDDLNGGAGMDVLYGDGGNDDLSGGSGDDVLRGGAGMDTLDGGSGMDMLEGGMGEDMLDGGSGMDTASYADSADAVMVNLMTGEGEDGDADGDTYTDIENLRGSMGDDTLTGDDMDNMLYGQMGEDNLAGMGGDDMLRGGKDDDKLDGGMGDDTLLGEMGDDRLYGGDGMDKFVFMMGHGDDEIADFEKGVDKIKFGTEMLTMAEANAVLDTKTTHAGQHTYTWEDVSVTVDVELDISDLYAEQPEPEPEPEPEPPPRRPTPVTVTHDLTDGNDTWPAERADQNDGNERVNAGKGNDTVYGGIGDDLLYGQDGNDSLMGEIGHDDLFGGKGNDKLEGGDGGDILKGEAGNDMLYGGVAAADGTAAAAADDPDKRYADTLEGGAGMDTMHGGAGDDMIIADFADLGALAALTFPATGQPVPAASITGGSGMDTISFEGEKDYPAGSAAATTPGTTGGVLINLYDATQMIEHFVGSERNDIVTQADADFTDDDAVAAGLQVNPIDYTGSMFKGEGGNDRFTGSSGAVAPDGGFNHDGDPKTPAITGRNDTVYGGDGNDMLDGNAGADMLDGGAGNDKLDGGAGMDTVMGGAGDDMIWGGNVTDLAADTIANTDDGVADVLSGGAGMDTFAWGDKDTITDFEVHGDTDIDLGITASATITRPHDVVELSRTADGKLQVTLSENAGANAGQTMYFEGIALPGTQAARDLLIDDMFDL